MNRDPWDQLVAAHTTIDALHDQMAALVTVLLDQLTAYADGQPDRLQQVQAQCTTGTALVRQFGDVLAELEAAIERLAPGDGQPASKARTKRAGRQACSIVRHLPPRAVAGGGPASALPSSERRGSSHGDGSSAVSGLRKRVPAGAWPLDLARASSQGPPGRAVHRLRNGRRTGARVESGMSLCPPRTPHRSRPAERHRGVPTFCVIFGRAALRPEPVGPCRQGAGRKLGTTIQLSCLTESRRGPKMVPKLSLGAP